MIHYYDIIDNFDNWRDADGSWTVNDAMIIARNVPLDLDTMSDRDIYRTFCDHAGYNNRLRAINITGEPDYYLDIIYTGKSLGGFYPLGAIVRSYSDIEDKREENNV